ncbi:MAG TPA: thioredoxin family protein [Lacibacter sp.]|nr:thioredoxin family protein [Lacibacter sp.]HMO88087.1 thioredoxin family protein [Lacibacter sp.]HMP86818.1 thioredoxin family protein [Lacibacter sp.]
MLKYTGTLLFFLVVLLEPVSAQTPYEESKDANGRTILKGILSRDALEQEPSFTWMKNDISWYKPNADCLRLLPELQDSIHLLVFAGTWCEDSHNVLPQLFKLLDQAKFPKEKISLLGVDRKKLTLGFLSESLGITNVPTILVMKNGKEVGRVVEYGKYGIYDKELAEILAAAKK